MSKEQTGKALRIAIIGSGPRGMSVLERLAARLAEEDGTQLVEIYLIDDCYVGTGRIWHTGQSPTLLMNTIAQEISAFSGAWDNGPARPGCGPSFAQWWQAHRCDYDQYGGYGPRALYGEYLLYVLAAVEKALPPNARLHYVTARVERLEELEDEQRLHFSGGQSLLVDATVLATGHPVNELQGLERRLADFAAATPSVRFVSGDSVADMNLDIVDAGEMVGIIGMGLTFYDLMGEFTTGRGGRFTVEKDGSMCYHPSGREPRLFAGSRSGMPIPARGLNQKPYDYEYEPAIFTLARAASIRRQGNVQFNRDALPLLEAELTLVHAETRLRLEGRKDAAHNLRCQVVERGAETSSEVIKLAEALGVSDPVSIDLYGLAAPFQRRMFNSPKEFASTLQDVLEADYVEAMRGNMDSPLKAALDVVRNTRSVIRTFVDFGGLDPESHKAEFLDQFSPASGFLSAGPPAFRGRQLQALMRAGIVTIVGPSVQFDPSPSDGSVYMHSPQVHGSTVAVQTVIDARLPTTDITRDRSGLTRSLVDNGIFVPFVNGTGDNAFETGGVNVTQSPFHPIRADRSIAERLYVLGIPTEHCRWFMQSGSSRPHKWIDFMIDADAIAADVLTVSHAAASSARRESQVAEGR